MGLTKDDILNGINNIDIGRAMIRNGTLIQNKII